MLLIIALLSIAWIDKSGIFAVEFFSENSRPFGIAYKDWVARWWNWWIGDVHKEDVSNNQLEKKNCLANVDGPVVFLMDPTFAGAQTREKICEISSDQGILFNFLTAECDTGVFEKKTVSYEELLNCAIEDDKGILQKEAFLDGQRIPDDKVHEIKTDQFNITIGENNVYDAEPGTYPAAAHGYYVFIQPLSLGNHTLQYKSALFGVPYGFTSDIIYRFMVTQ
jgi:hypothetical protein